MTEFKIQQNDAEQTIFNFIKKSYKETKLSIIYKWFRTGKIKLNGKKVKDQKIKISFEDVVIVFDTTSATKRDQFEPIDFSGLDIVYEDENILIADKPANLEVHSPINISLDQMVKSYLLDKGEYNPDEEKSFMVSHVHRIDKLTSGLVIYAKNKVSLSILLEAIASKEDITKKYLGYTDGEYNGPEAVIGYIEYSNLDQLAIFKEHEFRNSKDCSMLIKKINSELCEITLLSGRKHQIRATLKYFNAPIQNDFRYSARKLNNERYIKLIAKELTFNTLKAPLDYLNNKTFVSKYNY